MASFEPPKMESPKRPEDYPGRLIDCEAALDTPLQELIGQAFENGWAPGETFQALRRLISAFVRAEQEESRLEADLAIMRAMERARP